MCPIFPPKIVSMDNEAFTIWKRECCTILFDFIFFKIKIFLYFLTNQTENKEHSNHRLSLKYLNYINFPIKESNER